MMLLSKDKEKNFIMEHKSWAFTLFTRNIGTANDIKASICFLREVSECDDTFID